MKYLLKQKKYYKANLHTHSIVSDGRLTPEEVRDAYKGEGYSILALTDHSVIVEHPQLNQEDFLMITGVEIDMDDRDDPTGICRRRQKHLCLLSKTPHNNWLPYKDPEPKETSVPYEQYMDYGGMSREYSAENANRVIKACNEHGYLVTYNHPCWSLENYPDYAPLEGLWGMEYRNTGSINLGYDENNGRIYDDFLLQGKRLMPICADDMHRAVKPNGMVCLARAWTMVGAEELTYESVIEALEQGELYSSCGPEIHSVAWDGEKVHVKCSPCARIQVLTHTRVAGVAEGEDLTEATLDIAKWVPWAKKHENAYLRVIVTDAKGYYAVTRAYFKDELEEL